MYHLWSLFNFTKIGHSFLICIGFVLPGFELYMVEIINGTFFLEGGSLASAVHSVSFQNLIYYRNINCIQRTKTVNGPFSSPEKPYLPQWELHLIWTLAWFLTQVSGWLSLSILVLHSQKCQYVSPYEQGSSVTLANLMTRTGYQHCTGSRHGLIFYSDFSCFSQQGLRRVFIYYKQGCCLRCGLAVWLSLLMYPRVSMTSWSSCFNLMRSGITDMQYHAWLGCFLLNSNL